MKFKCPENFEPINHKDAENFYENLVEEDTELWIIKAPVDMKFEDEQKLNIDFDCEKLISHKLNDNYVYRMEPYINSEGQSTSLVLPSKLSSDLKKVNPKFAGQINISLDLKIPEPILFFQDKVYPGFPDDLKQRFEPFGSGVPYISKKKHKRKKIKSEESEMSILEKSSSHEITSDTPNKKKHKDKKIKKHSDSQEIHNPEESENSIIDENSFNANNSTLSSEKKHKKKKKKYVDQEIVNEIEKNSLKRKKIQSSDHESCAEDQESEEFHKKKKRRLK